MHQTLRALGRNGARIESALGVDHAADEIRIEVMPVADGIDDFIQVLRLQGCGLAMRAGARTGAAAGALPECCRYNRRRQVLLKPFDLVGGNIDVAFVGAKVETSH